MTLFTIFYFGIALILYVIAIPFLLVFSFKSKYRYSIPARFFLWRNPPFKKSGIYFHVASFGEVKSLKPLIELLDDRDVNISTITQTGYKEALKLSDNCRYLPYEIFLPFWIKKNSTLVVSEAELWYMLFLVSKLKGAKTYYINARISDNSYNKYLKFAWFYKKVFKNVDKVFAQSNKDRDRLVKLGAKNVVVNGNIKSFFKISITKKFQKPNRKIIVLASTHKDEERLILNNLDFNKGYMIIVVPRHPERFEDVNKLLKDISVKNNLTYHKYSQSDKFDSDIVLVDVLGELVNIYAISDVVILGGSFVQNVGGHNPLEPAYFHTKILSGKYIFNQKVLYDLVENIVMIEPEEIMLKIDNLKKTKIKQMGDIDPIIKELR